MKKMVIILAGMFLMGCEGEELAQNLQNGEKATATIEAQYLEEGTIFKNCSIESCSVADDSSVFYTFESDGSYIKVEVRFGSSEGPSFYTEQYDESVLGLLDGEIVDLEYTFNNSQIQVDIQGQNVNILVDGSDQMPSQWAF